MTEQLITGEVFYPTQPDGTQYNTLYVRVDGRDLAVPYSDRGRLVAGQRGAFRMMTSGLRATAHDAD